LVAQKSIIIKSEVTAILQENSKK